MEEKTLAIERVELSPKKSFYASIEEIESLETYCSVGTSCKNEVDHG